MQPFSRWCGNQGDITAIDSRRAGQFRRQRETRQVHPAGSIARRDRCPIDVAVVAVAEGEGQRSPRLPVNICRIEFRWKPRARSRGLRRRQQGLIAVDGTESDGPRLAALALCLFERARAVAEHSRYEFAAWYVAGNIERLEILLGHADRAVRAIRKRLGIVQARGAKYDEIVTRSNLAWGLRTLERHREALHELDVALELVGATGTDSGVPPRSRSSTGSASPWRRAAPSARIASKLRVRAVARPR